MDALHTVHKTFEMTVVDKQADFLVCVKDNAKDLRRHIRHILRCNRDRLQSAQTVDKGHGRIETRELAMTATTPTETGWPHTHTVCRATRSREIRRRGQTVSTSTEEVFYVASFAATTYAPDDVLKLIRGHWTIENGLPHRKDRSMDEDRNRAARKGCAAAMSCIRSLAALILGSARESLSVVQRRLSGKPHLLLHLLACHSVQQWLQEAKPYLPA